jgi:hypothetical protein
MIKRKRRGLGVGLVSCTLILPLQSSHIWSFTTKSVSTLILVNILQKAKKGITSTTQTSLNSTIWAPNVLLFIDKIFHFVPDPKYLPYWVECLPMWVINPLLVPTWVLYKKELLLSRIHNLYSSSSILLRLCLIFQTQVLVWLLYAKVQFFDHNCIHCAMLISLNWKIFWTSFPSL